MLGRWKEQPRVPIGIERFNTFFIDKNAQIRDSFFRRRTAACFVIIEDVAVDSCDFAAVVFLDLSEAFDTVNSTSMEGLQRSFVFVDSAHSWFSSYLVVISVIFVPYGSSTFQSTALECGVPQESVLAPILFLLYTVNQHCRQAEWAVTTFLRRR